MIKTRRARHMLFAQVALQCIADRDRLPSSKSVSLAAGIHPATARRWLADIKTVLPEKASALTQEKARA